MSVEKDIKVTLPDGSEVVHPSGVNGFNIAKAISPGLAKAAIAIKIDGVATDILAPINTDCSVEILTFDDFEGKQIFWHSSSHIMAQAVLDIFPKAKLAIGPPIEEGFYYDFDVEKPFAPEDLEKIEKRMGEIIKEKVTFERIDISRQEMLEKYKADGAVSQLR